MPAVLSPTAAAAETSSTEQLAESHSDLQAEELAVSVASSAVSSFETDESTQVSDSDTKSASAASGSWSKTASTDTPPTWTQTPFASPSQLKMNETDNTSDDSTSKCVLVRCLM